MLVLALAAFAVGMVVAGSSGPNVRAVVARYVRDWSQHQFRRMYLLLDRSSRRQLSVQQFIAQYKAAAQTATTRSLTVVRVENPTSREVPVIMRVRTAAFGTLEQTLLVSYNTTGPQPAVHFTDMSLFPGLLPGQRLSRSVSLAPRAAILARNGEPLAEGPDRSSPISSVAGGIVGVIGPIPAALVSQYAAAGYPPDTKVGVDGLERVFQGQAAGTPGGTLRAGTRVLAHTRPIPGRTVKTSIDPNLEAAAIAALGSHYGGVVAMDPRTGQLLALAGLAFSAVQPPGSTMKIITSTGALQAGIVKLGTTFPIATFSVIGGYTLKNAGGEACGGTLLNAFAVSCNSVFAPLGVRLGGQRLVATAERFGFNKSVGIPGATESTIPAASQIGGATAVGSSAIGQGMVQASTLEMTDVAATIAMGGRRPVPTLRYGRRPRFVHVTNPHVASEVQQMMVAVVESGTGISAQISGVQVAGKTGTAEINNSKVSTATNPTDADAWFVGYAPVGAPRIVAGALFVNEGFGGSSAAPAVRDVIVAGLQGH
ncbi:MAG TPA: penicillin-binding transpeptidase domain-containing protein [Solirubrobacteraceae bacterium]